MGNPRTGDTSRLISSRGQSAAAIFHDIYLHRLSGDRAVAPASLRTQREARHD
jgi:hypothetical protein